MTRAGWTNLLLVLAVVALAVVPLAVAPLVFPAGPEFAGPEFAGADSVAQERILADNPGYEPWFTPIWEPPSGEVASGLFALQAALGAGFLGYYFGVARTRRKLGQDG